MFLLAFIMKKRLGKKLEPHNKLLKKMSLFFFKIAIEKKIKRVVYSVYMYGKNLNLFSNNFGLWRKCMIIPVDYGNGTKIIYVKQRSYV